MDGKLEVIRLLADGAQHSGPALAEALGCSRAAVWKQLQGLPELGLEVEASRARGYRLSHAIDLLDAYIIKESVAAEYRALFDSFQFEPIQASTSEALRRRPPPPAGQLQVALAEYQTGGRGRRGRTWSSPFGAGICLSLGYLLQGAPGGLGGLSLALGVASQQALSRCGARGLQLKWPNDLVAGDRKLGGLLVDLSGEADGPLHVIVGLGLNVHARAALRAAVAEDGGLAPVALEELATELPSRNQIVARLIEALGGALARYQREGFSPFADTWQTLDSLQGKSVRVSHGKESWLGEARGIGADGALLVERDGATVPVLSGEVSVRGAS